MDDLLQDVVLTGVTYYLFDYEVEHVNTVPDGHIIARQVQLDFADGSTRYVTWFQVRDGEWWGDDRLGVVAETMSLGEAVLFDAALLPLWAPLLGCAVRMHFEQDKQVLVISGNNHSALLSEGSAYRDPNTIHIKSGTGSQGEKQKAEA